MCNLKNQNGGKCLQDNIGLQILSMVILCVIYKDEGKEAIVKSRYKNILKQFPPFHNKTSKWDCLKGFDTE